MPIILHGDAAFPGQGVVAETLNLQALDGYTVGGTIHLIQNNQVGFTTDPDDARSTRWASDLAKGFDVPIIHVNADDVEACIAAVRLAFAFRQEFGHDVLIDLIGYRRFGHNEADEPAYTQPEMSAKIKEQDRRCASSSPRSWSSEGVITQEESDALAPGDLGRASPSATASSRSSSPRAERRAADRRLRARPHALARGQDRGLRRPPAARSTRSCCGSPRASPSTRSWSSSSSAGATALGPDGGIDWAQAEALAFASLLTEGTPIRLTGQDTERGTFSQRHLVLHDAKTGQRISPIQNLPGALAPMELHNSPLSEIACLGFEYGYSMEAPETLVLWEAQFGDFVNSAQVIIDQFIVSRAGQVGPDLAPDAAAAARLRGLGARALLRAAGALPRSSPPRATSAWRTSTTPAQYFHLLRRQARVAKQRPLVIMTPKSLLRLPQATVADRAPAESRFYPVLAEPRIDEEKVTRLVLCTGKIYYDLKGHATRENNEGVAISRVELLYPFPQQPDPRARSRATRTCARSCGCRRSRATWAPARTCRRGCCRSCPSTLEFGYIGRPERAVAGRGLPGRPHASSRTGSSGPRSTSAMPVSVNPAKQPGER